MASQGCPPPSVTREKRELENSWGYKAGHSDSNNRKGAPEVHTPNTNGKQRGSEKHGASTQDVGQGCQEWWSRSLGRELSNRVREAVLGQGRTSRSPPAAPPMPLSISPPPYLGEPSRRKVRVGSLSSCSSCGERVDVSAGCPLSTHMASYGEV